MKNKTILELHNDLLNKKITVLEINQYYLNNLKKIIDAKSNAILLSFEKQVLEQAKALDVLIKKDPSVLKDNYLFGIPCSLKDNVCLKGYTTTGGSLFLKDFVPCYDATVVSILKQKNVIFNSKTNMDELGLGGTGLYSGFKDVINIDNPKYIVGGSSSGSALLMQQFGSVFSITTDTGDSIRRPASLMGIVGYKPSYGLISRYGVLPYAPSLDHVGVMTRNVSDLVYVLDSIVKYDAKDATSVDKKINFIKDSKPIPKVTIGLVDGLESYWTKNKAHENFNKFIDSLKTNKNISFKSIKIDPNLVNIISSLYKVISYAEAVSSWNNLNGLLFGNNKDLKYSNFEDLLFKVRTQYLSDELKKRFVLGNIATNYENFNDVYLKSKQIVEYIKSLFHDYFKDVDAFLIPSCHTDGILKEDVLNNKTNSTKIDDLMQFANFAHLPSITIPLYSENKLHFGINLFADKYEDQKLINIALLFEQLIKGSK